MIKKSYESIKSLYNLVYDKNTDPDPFYIPVLEDAKNMNVLQKLLLNKSKDNLNAKS